jgi:hypothetical protein
MLSHTVYSSKHNARDHGILTGPLSTIPITIPAGTSESSITSLAYEPIAGTLYANTTAGFGATADRLYSFDPATGAERLHAGLRDDLSRPADS